MGHREQTIARAARWRAAHPEESRESSARTKARYRDKTRAQGRTASRWFSANLRILSRAQGCADCSTHDGKLNYHHIDPSTKRRNVSQMSQYQVESFVDEIAKCVVLCNRCHARRHAQMAQERDLKERTS